MENQVAGGIAAGAIVLFMLLAFIGLACAVFWIWMLVHAATNPGIAGTEKLAWVLVVFFASFLGALIYFFVARPKARQAKPT